MQVRMVIPAPSGTPCGWTAYGETGTLLTCAGGNRDPRAHVLDEKDSVPAMAVHVLTGDLPVAKAGTALCGFHSPWDVTDADRAATAATVPGSVAERVTKATKARMSAVHYAEGTEVRGACGLKGATTTDPDEATCRKCPTTRRYLNAVHAKRVGQCRERFADAGIREGMMVRHRATGCLGMIRSIKRTCDLGLWGPWRSPVDSADYIHNTPESLLNAFEVITIDDLVTVDSTVTYGGKTYTVTKVSMAGGVDLREVGSWRAGAHMSATDFAADMSRGVVKVVTLAPTGAESDPLATLVADAAVKAHADMLDTFREGVFILVRDSRRFLLAKIIASGEQYVTYVRADDCTYSRTVGWDEFANMIRNGVIKPTTVCVDELGDAVHVRMVRPGDSRISAAHSRELFVITGRGVHNSGSRHQVNAYTGVCCDVDKIHMHLSAQPTVISAHPQASVTTFQAIIGDVIMIDHEVWRVTNQRHADPILTPVRFESSLAA